MKLQQQQWTQHVNNIHYSSCCHIEPIHIHSQRALDRAYIGNSSFEYLTHLTKDIWGEKNQPKRIETESPALTCVRAKSTNFVLFRAFSNEFIRTVLVFWAHWSSGSISVLQLLLLLWLLLWFFVCVLFRLFHTHTCTIAVAVFTSHTHTHVMNVYVKICWITFGKIRHSVNWTTTTTSGGGNSFSETITTHIQPLGSQVAAHFEI